MHYFQPLRPYLRGQVGYASEIAARSVEAADKSKRDGVATCEENDRNCCSRCLCRQCPSTATGRGNDGHRSVNEIGYQDR